MFNIIVNFELKKTIRIKKIGLTFRKLTQGEKYNYFPRGRVEISHGKAEIYANPNICNNELKNFIINEFNLTKHNGISEVVMQADGSKHYKCFLDT